MISRIDWTATSAKPSSAGRPRLQPWVSGIGDPEEPECGRAGWASHNCSAHELGHSSSKAYIVLAFTGGHESCSSGTSLQALQEYITASTIKASAPDHGGLKASFISGLFPMEIRLNAQELLVKFEMHPLEVSLKQS